ncbi:Serine/threonine-protein kinase Nek10 [Pleodorina starrii]|uniref:non-specific serine/threonine protein kinase n=1 Tax=Pleodorina starrii TaxID=330485 RepID=A0A9W6BEJ2_9CHLO|nr:Serine/threonine-protein kinase Nek10 [Pleodorina starrii]GLC50061.1 Serine/threonine-protein kinase Nek10 [Pleodorina starrii]GLC73158.1 Serine/threonine-protein kinase Nek10 [Pleodorina starrii]
MSVPAAVVSLIQLLRQNPASQTANQAAQEASLLEDVAVQYSGKSDFEITSTPCGKAFGELFDTLVRFRLVQSPWRCTLRPEHLLRVLQCTRLLSRDAVLRQRLLETGAIKILCLLFREQAAAHFSGTITSFQIEVLTECASIMKRLAVDEWGLAALASEEAYLTLLQLLNSTDPAVLQLVLVVLIGFAAHRTHYTFVTSPAALETLLRIVTEYDMTYKRLAANVLALLARREPVVLELLALSGLGRLVGQLVPGGDSQLTASLLRVLCYVATNAGAAVEMYHVGSIPVLMSLVSAAVRDLASNPTHNCLPPSRVTELQLVATCLTRLAEHDECAAQIRACNAVTLLGKLLMVQAPPQKPEAPGGTQPEPNPSREVLSLKAYVFRALRYLFSVERNRKMFKRLFPPELFAAFIDAGHYNAQLIAYAPLVKQFEELSEKQRLGVSAALDDVSVAREGSGLRSVGGYVILEMLGKGAFGAVYKARKSRGESLVALKELPLSDIGLFGATESEVSAGVGRMCKEVQILSSLSHPNIVQYYESFACVPYLYIAMELVEGTSLLDHLQGLEQKGRRMPEQDIWQVLIAVILALNYIHSVKKIVHRDLTPSNIVLGQGAEGLRHTKIADFGLAKRLSSSVVAQSMVGTMPYTCPEIIQQEPYSEKADVWSLGCVAYHCVMLRPPFDGSNPLSVAHKIVEGAYDPPADPPATAGPPYSAHLKRLIGTLMTVDPKNRPSISEVAALVSGQLMASLERAALNEQRMTKALQMERTALQAHRRLGSARGEVAAGLGGAAGAAGGVGAVAPVSNVSSPLRTIACRKTSLGPLGAAMGDLGSTTANGGGGAAGGSGALVQQSASPKIADGLPLDRLDSLGSGGEAGPGPSSSLGGTPGAGGGSGSLRTVTLATSRLKPITDPLTLMLTQLHKVMWVEQLPPGLARDHRRRAVESFRRHLFAQGSHAGSIKASLAKLLHGASDLVTDSAGRPIDFGSVPLAPGDGDTTTAAAAAAAAAANGGAGPAAAGGGAGTTAAGGGGAASGAAAVSGLSSDGHLTYEQLSGVLESLLVDKGYYSGGGMGGVGGSGGSGGMVMVSEAELLDQLPLPNFNATAHVAAQVAAAKEAREAAARETAASAAGLGAGGGEGTGGGGGGGERGGGVAIVGERGGTGNGTTGRGYVGLPPLRGTR